MSTVIPEPRRTLSSPELSSSAAAPSLLPPAAVLLDRFDPDVAVKSLQLTLNQSQQARAAADIIYSCLAPVLIPKGPADEQVWLFFLRLMGRIQSEQRSKDSDNAEIERLQQRIKSEQLKVSEADQARFTEACGKLEKLGAGLLGQQQSKSEEQNRIAQGLASISESQHQAIMASLREMRQV